MDRVKPEDGKVYYVKHIGFVTITKMEPEEIEAYNDALENLNTVTGTNYPLGEASFRGTAITPTGKMSFMYRADGSSAGEIPYEGYGDLLEEQEGFLISWQGYPPTTGGQFPFGSFSITNTTDGFVATRIDKKE